MPTFEGNLRYAPGTRFAILLTRWNARITDALLQGALKALRDHGVEEEGIDVFRIPGAWEIPQLAARLIAAERHDAIIALGCVVRGDTRHYEHVADNCAAALMQLASQSDIPLANGVLAVDRMEDAEARAGGVHGNKGEEAALAALEMLNLYDQLTELEAEEEEAIRAFIEEMGDEVEQLDSLPGATKQ